MFIIENATLLFIGCERQHQPLSLQAQGHAGKGHAGKGLRAPAGMQWKPGSTTILLQSAPSAVPGAQVCSNSCSQ